MTTKTDITLLPCPFCGESKSLIVQHCEGTIIHPAYRIYCGNCGASSSYADRVDPAKHWNRRAALQSQDREDVKRLDWLDKTAHCADWMDGEPTKRVIRAHDGAEFTGDTWREAIDHARRAEGEEG